MTWWPPTTKGWKIIGGCLAGIVLLGAILFAADRITGWWSMRKIDKLKANVNAATQELKDIQANVQKEKIAEAVALEKVKEAANAVVIATNATDAAKEETNRSLQNLANAVNANRPVDVTATDLEKRLKDLNE